MDPSVPVPDPSTHFSLRGRPRAITLEPEGLHHPGSARGGPLVFTGYGDITHLATSARAVWIGTRRSVHIVARRSFVDPDGPENLVRALLEQIARRPGGSEQLARMAEIEEAARTAGSLRATWGLAALCVAAFALEWWAGQIVHEVGYFTPALVADGDWWRLVTANLLHAGPLHLAINLLGLLAIGSLLEHSIGTARSTIVMVASGLGSMAVSALWTPVSVVGVSGVISGLVGALLWLELSVPDRLPAWWRVPRRALFWGIALTALLGLLPFIAGAAHAGGFLAGGLACAGLTRGRLAERPSRPPVRAAAAVSLAVALAGVGAASWELARGGFAARHMLRLGLLPDASPNELNNAAWVIAIDRRSPRELLEKALDLAERAVAETGRAQPHILDTLAEVYFQLGRVEDAVATIEEAIRLAPLNRYYREQRARFLGLRPESPAPWEQQELILPNQPGITV